MATRRTRSSLSNDSPLAVAKPFKATKRRKPRDLSATEQKEVSKHEIKVEQFTYRLRGVRNILKTLSDDNDTHSAGDEKSSGKKSRRSKLRGGKRKSVVDSVLMRNFQLSLPADTVEDSAISEKKKETEELKTFCNEDVANEGENSNSEKLKNEEKADIEALPNKNKINGEKRKNQIPSEESSEEIIARKEKEKRAREETLENIEKLQKEQAEWIELYEKYQKQLSDAQLNAESDTNAQFDKDCFSVKQRDFLAGRIDAQAFVDRLTSYQNKYTLYATEINDFYQRLQEFKENASDFIQAHEANNAVTQQNDSGFETPRKLIMKLIQNDPN